jgi:hypothetical protein
MRGFQLSSSIFFAWLFRARCAPENINAMEEESIALTVQEEVRKGRSADSVYRMRALTPHQG